MCFVGYCQNINGLDEKSKEADALIMFSCGSRILIFGPLMEDEVRGIKDIWDAPLVGFYCSGEYGNKMNEATNFHNHTCVFVILKEK